MGCIGSTFFKTKHRLLKNKFSRQFQIPEIVVEEYMSSYSVDNLNKSYTKDYLWLKDSDFKATRFNWFFDSYDSVAADCLLRNKPDGTFLVRRSQQYEGQYVLLISIHYFIHDFPIIETDEGFGLIESGFHPTLESLINYYSEVSLETKNTNLDTRLVKGVFQT